MTWRVRDWSPRPSEVTVARACHGQKDSYLGDTFEHWKQLQEEFKTWHRQADQIRAQPIRPQEIKNGASIFDLLRSARCAVHAACVPSFRVDRWQKTRALLRCCAAFLPFVSSLFSPAPRVQRAVVVVAPRAMRAAPPPVGGGVIKELI